MNNHKLKTYAGEHIEKVLQEAKSLSIELGKNVEFEFNGILCIVNEGTNREHLLRDYNNAHLMEWETIGPECYEEYPIDVANLIVEKTAEQDRKEAERQAEYHAKQAKRLADYEAETFGIVMEYSDKALFDEWHSRNQDGYGNAVFVYAQQWAKLMQARMNSGFGVKDVAKQASYDADTVGLSGTQYGFAVALLQDTWVYGNELAKWNKLPYDQQ